MKKLGISYKFFIMLFTVYFSCNSFVLAIKYESYTTLIMTALTVVMFVIAIFAGRNQMPREAFFLMLLGGINLGLTTLANGYTNAYMLLVLNFVLCFAYIRLFSRQEFYENFILVMRLLAVFAVTVGVVNIVVPQLFGGVNAYESSTGYVYYDLILSFQSVEGTRINSIWGEPGMFAVFLIFALILEGFYVERELRVANCIIFIAAIILTFSAAGIICLIIVLAAMLLRKNQSSGTVKILAAFLGVLILAVLAYNYLPWFQEALDHSLGKLSSEEMSFTGRIAPIFHNLKVGVQSILWGQGLQGGRFYVEFMDYHGYLFCNTSTTTFLFASFGLTLAGITIYLTAKLSGLCQQQSIWVKLLLFIVLLINVNTQAVHLDQIYWLLLFSVFMDRKKVRDH